MKKILILTTTYPTFLPEDGTPPFVHELTKRLASLGAEMIVLAPRRPGTQKYEIQDGVTVIRYPYFFFSSREKIADGAILPNLRKKSWLYVQIPFLCLGCCIALISVVRKYTPQIIHAHWIFINGFIAALYKKFLNKNIKLIITSHGSDLHSLNGGVIDKIKKRSINQSDEVTVVSEFLKKKLDELMGKEVVAQIIPMGVDEEHFHPRKIDISLRKKYGITGKYVLYVGRLVEEKGVKDLIDAMGILVKKQPDCKLLIIGHGPLEDELKMLVKNMHLTGSILFLGAVPNYELPRYYATADLFVMPSYIESFGMTIIESNMSGTPVISSLYLQEIGLLDGVTNGKYIALSTLSEHIDDFISIDPIDIRSKVLKYARGVSVRKFLPLYEKQDIGKESCI